jgi:copper transport protein
MSIDRKVQPLLQRLTIACVCLALTLTLSPVAYGHAKLVRSQPKAKETLASIPRVVELWFSEPLESGLNTIEVKDSTGKRVDKGDVTLAEENKKAVVNLDELPPGSYTVNWKALSADQHPMRGMFTFSVSELALATSTTPVTATPAPTPPASAPREDISAQSYNTGDSISWPQTFVRWLSYLAMMLVFGGFAFRQMVLTPALRGTAARGDQNQLLLVASRRVISMTWIGAILLLVTSLFALVLQASEVFDKSLLAAMSPGLLRQVLSTGFGPSWLIQISSLIAVNVVLLFLSIKAKAKRHTGLSIFWWVGLLAAAVLLVAPSWTGHAMLAVKHFRLAVITDWLHLLAAGFWVGGLFHLVLSCKPISALVTPDRRALLLHQLIKSFTRIAVPSVVLLLFAGFYNTWAHVPRVSALWMTPYGEALALKLLFVLLMLFLGAVNNYYFGKRAARLVSDNTNADSEIQLERSFVRSVRFEAALAVILLLVTAVLVFLTPARNHPAMEQAAGGEASLRQH